jgi:hypothetical protein
MKNQKFIFNSWRCFSWHRFQISIIDNFLFLKFIPHSTNGHQNSQIIKIQNQVSSKRKVINIFILFFSILFENILCFFLWLEQLESFFLWQVRVTFLSVAWLPFRLFGLSELNFYELFKHWGEFLVSFSDWTFHFPVPYYQTSKRNTFGIVEE